MKVSVLALDPGFSTGYASITIDALTNELTLDEYGVKKFGPGDQSQLFGMEGRFVLGLINPRRKAKLNGEVDEFVVAMEDFVGSGHRNNNAIYVLKLVGLIVGLTEVRRTKLSVQAPQWRKPFLKESGRLITEHKQAKPIIHEQDALAHGLAYTYRERLWIPEE